MKDSVKETLNRFGISLTKETDKGTKSVKIHNPYDFNKNTNWGCANCLIGFSNDVENSVLTILNSRWDYGYKCKYKEITKEMIGH